MRANAGAGIRTLTDLKARCDIVGQCWLWTGHCSSGKPQVSLFYDGKKRNLAGRRVGLLLAGKNVESKVVYAKACCKSPDCIAPEHSQATSRPVQRKKLAALGVLKGNPRLKAAAARNGAAKRFAKLGPAKAAEMRARTDLSLSELGKAFGVSKSAAGAVRRAEVYRAHAGASVFTWRPA